MTEDKYTELVSAVNRLIPLVRQSISVLSVHRTGKHLIRDLDRAVYRIEKLTKGIVPAAQTKGTMGKSDFL